MARNTECFYECIIINNVCCRYPECRFPNCHHPECRGAHQPSDVVKPENVQRVNANLAPSVAHLTKKTALKKRLAQRVMQALSLSDGSVGWRVEQPLRRNIKIQNFFFRSRAKCYKTSLQPHISTFDDNLECFSINFFEARSLPVACAIKIFRSSYDDHHE